MILGGCSTLGIARADAIHRCLPQKSEDFMENGADQRGSKSAIAYPYLDLEAMISRFHMMLDGGCEVGSTFVLASGVRTAGPKARVRPSPAPGGSTSRCTLATRLPTSRRESTVSDHAPSATAARLMHRPAERAQAQASERVVLQRPPFVTKSGWWIAHSGPCRCAQQRRSSVLGR